ncbi:MAG: hypothetical protein HQK54_11355 [Oligoflexales bacterium]|nr:hypothetical protein [Oligoflexales bacterium]
MFLTVSPIGKEPFTLNFSQVESIRYNSRKRLTEIVLYPVATGRAGRRYFVKESLHDIHRMLESVGKYESYSVGTPRPVDAAPQNCPVQTQKGKPVSDDETSVASVRYADFCLEIRLDEKENTIRPFLKSPIEARYLADPIEASAKNLASLLLDMGRMMADNVLTYGDTDDKDHYIRYLNDGDVISGEKLKHVRHHKGDLTL